MPGCSRVFSREYTTSAELSCCRCKALNSLMPAPERTWKTPRGIPWNGTSMSRRYVAGRGRLHARKLEGATMLPREGFAGPNVRINRRAEAGRLSPVGETVPRTANRAKVACRSASG